MDEIEMDWVDSELSELALSDKRLTERAKTIVRNFAGKPNASIPEFSQDWAGTKATYNFLNNEGASALEIVAAQRQASLARMSEHPLVLAIQDTTEINLTHFPKTAGMGPISSGQSRGFLTHSTLAVTPAGVPLGLLAQENWVRDVDEIGKSASRRERPIEEKESYKWLKALSESMVDLPPATQVLMVSDRESDVLEYFLHPRPQQVDLLIRSAQDRSIDGSEFLLWQTVRRSPLQGVVTVEVERKGDQPARTATCHIRYQSVTVRLLWLTYLGRVGQDLSCTVALQDFEWKALFCFIHKTQIPPQTPPSLQQAIRWIAQLGGFLARSRDGDPGVKALWQGWRRLDDLAQTWLIFNPLPT